MGTFATVKPYSLRSFFHLSAAVYLRRHGSYPRREKAEQKALRGGPHSRGTSHGARSPHFPLWEVTSRMEQPLVLMEQPNECAIKRAVGPATCLGGGQGDRPTRATYQLTLRILCLLLSNDLLATQLIVVLAATGDGVRALSRSPSAVPQESAQD